MALPPILRFAPTYFERIWGGTLMRDVLGMPVPQDKIIGEAWLVSDHPHCESVVEGGPLNGLTLRALVRDHAEALLGKAERTPTGRFPLLLKLIDAGDLLSVQVHPDDAAAIRLGEPDVGKTEMWYVMEAAPGAELIYGMKPGTDRATFEGAVEAGRSEECLQTYPAERGTHIFVPAGTVHAIGSGLLIAEIQQNSDITYRIYDYNRLDPAGKPRQLHIDKALEVIDFDTGNRQPEMAPQNATSNTLADCEYFATRLLCPGQSPMNVEHTGNSFQVFLATADKATLVVGSESVNLEAGQAALVPASAAGPLTVSGGALLQYSVPSR